MCSGVHSNIFDMLFNVIRSLWESFRELKRVVMSFVNNDLSNVKDFESLEIGLRVCSEKQGTAQLYYTGIVQ